jgi:hypothetical protein
VSNIAVHHNINYKYKYAPGDTVKHKRFGGGEDGHVTVKILETDDNHGFSSHSGVNYKAYYVLILDKSDNQIERINSKIYWWAEGIDPRSELIKSGRQRRGW